MSTVQLFKPEPQTQYEYNWKVAEIESFLDMYFDDHSVGHLISAEYELRNLIDRIVNKEGPDDPPF